MALVPRAYEPLDVTVPVSAAVAAFSWNQLYEAASNAYNTAAQIVSGANRVYNRARRIQEQYNRLTQAVRYERSWFAFR